MLVLGIKQIKTVILSKSSKPNAGNIQLYWPGLGCVPGNPLAQTISNSAIANAREKIGDCVGRQALLALWLARILIQYKSFSFICLLMGD